MTRYFAVVVVLSGALLATPPLQAQERIERGALVLENIPEASAELRESLRQYQEARGASFADWMPDGRSLLIATRFGETAQLHRVDQPLGMRRQVTFFSEPVANAASQPGGAGLVFEKDQGGDEYDQLYYLDLATGQATRLTDGRRSLNRGALWSADGRRLAYAHTPEGTSRYQLRVAEAGRLGDARVVLDEEGAWGVVDWSRDGRRLVVARYVSITESTLHLLDLETGDLSQVNPGKGPIAYGAARLAPDGQTLYAVSDEDSEFGRLVRFDLASGEQALLTPGLDWDVSDFDLSPDGRQLVYFVNEAGISRAYLLDTRRGRVRPIEGLPTGVTGGGRFSPDGRRFAFTLTRAVSPADVYVYDLRANRLEQWTDSEVGGLDKSRFVDAGLVRLPSFDGLEITSFVQKPAGPGPHPVIIDIHGGPEAQFRPMFSPVRQHWVNELGFAVFGPNVRGSSGFGKTFVSLDNGMKREHSVRDLEALVDWIRANPEYDASRIVVYGGSYGGYMVNAAMTTFPEKLAGGVSIVGISDFITFLENTAEYRRDLRRVEYGDERDPAMRAEMERLSPLRRAARIDRPFFVIHGANDPRVPASEAEQLVAAARANGAAPWFMLARNEGHGFARKENRDAMTEAVALFLRDRILAR
ncbi:MAG: S9 family peptidase [Steroidobacteraceae bacterium]|jgi:dipeptidyl aminopeptidase/acylaminoacyl peptidase|nr:S9 family peptidase [Steroidobacteraceae bacterium]